MKSYTNKQGELKEYDQKKYNNTYYLKNKDKIAEEVYTCECCNKEGIKKRNKYNHEKSEKHKLKLELKNLQQKSLN